MKYVFIVNPAAGKNSCEEQVAQQIATCGLLEQDYEVLKTTCPGDAEVMARQACQKYPEVTIFSCGGDGTLLEIINGMGPYSHAVLGIMPFGSGNDFIRSITTKEKAKSLAQQLRGKTKTIDLLKHNDEICIGIASVGVDADVAYKKDVYKNLPLVSGSGAYVLSLIARLFKPLNTSLKVELDGKQVFNGNCVIAVAANASYYGGGFCAAPHAVLNDGKINVIVVHDVGLLRLASVLSLYQKGEHIKDGKVVEKYRDIMDIYTCHSCRFSANTPFIGNADGNCRPTNCMELSVIPDSLRVLIP